MSRNKSLWTPVSALLLIFSTSNFAKATETSQNSCSKSLAPLESKNLAERSQQESQMPSLGEISTRRELLIFDLMSKVPSYGEIETWGPQKRGDPDLRQTRIEERYEHFAQEIAKVKNLDESIVDILWNIGKILNNKIETDGFMDFLDRSKAVSDSLFQTGSVDENLVIRREKAIKPALREMAHQLALLATLTKPTAQPIRFFSDRSIHSFFHLATHIPEKDLSGVFREINGLQRDLLENPQLNFSEILNQSSHFQALAEEISTVQKRADVMFFSMLPGGIENELR